MLKRAFLLLLLLGCIQAQAPVEIVTGPKGEPKKTWSTFIKEPSFEVLVKNTSLRTVALEPTAGPMWYTAKPNTEPVLLYPAPKVSSDLPKLAANQEARILLEPTLEHAGRYDFNVLINEQSYHFRLVRLPVTLSFNGDKDVTSFTVVGSSASLTLRPSVDTDLLLRKEETKNISICYQPPLPKNESETASLSIVRSAEDNPCQRVTKPLKLKVTGLPETMHEWTLPYSVDGVERHVTLQVSRLPLLKHLTVHPTTTRRVAVQPRVFSWGRPTSISVPVPVQVAETASLSFSSPNQDSTCKPLTLSVQALYKQADEGESLVQFKPACALLSASGTYALSSLSLTDHDVTPGIYEGDILVSAAGQETVLSKLTLSVKHAWTLPFLVAFVAALIGSLLHWWVDTGRNRALRRSSIVQTEEALHRRFSRDFAQHEIILMLRAALTTLRQENEHARNVQKVNARLEELRAYTDFFLDRNAWVARLERANVVDELETYKSLERDFLKASVNASPKKVSELKSELQAILGSVPGAADIALAAKTDSQTPNEPSWFQKHQLKLIDSLTSIFAILFGALLAFNTLYMPNPSFGSFEHYLILFLTSFGGKEAFTAVVGPRLGDSVSKLKLP